MGIDVSSKIQSFFSEYRLREYDKGQVLILSGDDADYVYLLVSGRVKQYDVTYRGDEVILNTFKPGAFFPMSMAINKVPSQFIYEAESDIVIRQAPVEEVIGFIKSNPDVLFDLLSRVYKGIDGLMGRMVHLMTSSAKGRLMFELLVEFRRFGEVNGDKKCETKINEKELAARSGLSRETVSREMHKLVKAGLIKFESGVVTVDNVNIFEAKLNKTI